PNVLITKFGEVKIVDFGLAKASSQLEKSEPGIIKGKFSYLSPEAAQGQDVDARTDIFAVGIILWELLTGQRLFLGETDFQTVKKVQEGRVPPMTAFNPRITKELEEIVQKSLARDPAERYLTARDLGKDLARHLYKIGVPVSSFDVESLVQGTMREIKKTRAPQVSIIDKLIEEALLEFTSLKDDEKPASSSGESRSSSPLNIGEFEDPSKWLNEMGMEPVKSYKADPRISLHDATRKDGSLGTLSALEDESARRIRLATPSPSSSSIAIGTPGSRPEPRLTAPKPIDQKKPTALIVALVSVLLLLMIAVAWALKIIPH
nr:protein kinase [Polyangiaceae bacterium]